MENSGLPQNFNLAGLRTRQPAVNLMDPGPGTPWEDRGNLGLFKAFFQTCFYTLRQPARLFNLIRRPETTSDATWFAAGCGLFWTAAILIHALIAFYYYQSAYQAAAEVARISNQGYSEIDFQPFFTRWAVVAFFMPVVAYLLMQLATRIFYAMASVELHGTPSTLTFNLFCYCLGPSILAIIPVIGPPLALCWIAALMVGSAAWRQRMSTRSAATCAVVAFFACFAIAVVGVLIFRSIWGLFSEAPIRKIDPPRIRQLRG